MKYRSSPTFGFNVESRKIYEQLKRSEKGLFFLTSKILRQKLKSTFALRNLALMLSSYVFFIALFWSRVIVPVGAIKLKRLRAGVLLPKQNLSRFVM